jgi:replicative DNA helicase
MNTAHEIDRGLPANVDAERTILGAILNDNAAFYECGDLQARCFSLDTNQRLFDRIGEMLKAGSPVDLVTLANHLGKAKEIESIGGVVYLSSLTEGLPRRPVIDRYIQIVRDKWALRELMSVCSAAVARAADQSEESADVIADIDRQLLEIATCSEREPSLEAQTSSAFKELLDIREQRTEPATATGISNLDRIIGGYKRKRLYVVGGRPSMGKTSLMIEAAIQHCCRGIRSRLISLEMTAEELLHRIYAAVSEIPFERLVDPGTLRDDDWEQVETARNLVAGWPLEIDDRDGQTIDLALAGCRLSCRRRGTRFVALDYVQNLRFTGPAKLRYQEISDATKRMRQFAKEENVPFLLLSSLTEGQDKNPNKRPTLADLRGSGDLAFHADVAMLIHRDRGEDGASIDRRTEIIVAKQRGGRTGTAKAIYNTDTLLFEENR